MSILTLTIKTLIIFELMSILAIAGSPVNDTPQTYRSYIDNSYGFYKIRSVTPNINVQYDVTTRTLTINQGDTVVWLNDAENNVPFTIISDQGLWSDGDKDAYLAYSNKQFGYTFDVAGSYNFHLKEYPKVKQTIMVNIADINANATDNYPTPTAINMTITTPIPTLTPTQIITPTPIPTPIITPTQSPTPIEAVEKTDVEITEIPDIDIKADLKTIMTTIVAILSMFITYKFSK